MTIHCIAYEVLICNGLTTDEQDGTPSTF